MKNPIELLQANLNEPRTKVLLEAAAAVLQDRNADYGAPEDNFTDIIDMWNIYRRGMKKEPDAKDAAVFQIIVKLCRLKQSPYKMDNWIDISGYSACGYRAATTKQGVELTNCKVDVTKGEWKCFFCNARFDNEGDASQHSVANGHYVEYVPLLVSPVNPVPKGIYCKQCDAYFQDGTLHNLNNPTHKKI